MTNLAFVIGDPIVQSKSPLIHEAAYKVLGIDDSWCYSRKQVSTVQLKDFINEVRQSCQSEDPIRGFSVTMPLKQDIIPLLDEVDDLALEVEAVNTVVVSEEGKLSGYNTDIYGIVAAVEPELHLPQNEQVQALILGSGATSRSATAAARQLGAKPKDIKFASRHPELGHINISDEVALNTAINGSDVVISTLPWGGAQEVLLNSRTATALERKVVLECAFPKVLESSIDGSLMLIHQAIKQVELMTALDLTQNSDLHTKAFDAMLGAMNTDHSPLAPRS
jgi:shikimate dehydrogenase